MAQALGMVSLAGPVEAAQMVFTSQEQLVSMIQHTVWG